MEANEVLTQARDTLTVKRVFGEQYEKNGVAVTRPRRSRGAPEEGTERVQPGKAGARKAVSG
jgi:hypothetical protein